MLSRMLPCHLKLYHMEHYLDLLPMDSACSSNPCVEGATAEALFL